MTTAAAQVGDRPRPTPVPSSTIPPMPTSEPPTDPPYLPPAATLDLSYAELQPVLASLDARKTTAQQEVDAAQRDLDAAQERLSALTTNHALLKSRMDTLGSGKTLSITVNT